LSDGNDRTELSTAGEKGLPAVLKADRENVAVLIYLSDRGPGIIFEKLETLGADAKALLTEALTRAADFVATSATSEVRLLSAGRSELR
jgi:hypothetical protein